MGTSKCNNNPRETLSNSSFAKITLFYKDYRDNIQYYSNIWSSSNIVFTYISNSKIRVYIYTYLETTHHSGLVVFNIFYHGVETYTEILKKHTILYQPFLSKWLI